MNRTVTRAGDRATKVNVEQPAMNDITFAGQRRKSTRQ